MGQEQEGEKSIVCVFRGNRKNILIHVIEYFHAITMKLNNFIKLKKIIFNKCDLRAIKIKRNGEPENNQMISLNESGI